MIGIVLYRRLRLPHDAPVGFSSSISSTRRTMPYTQLRCALLSHFFRRAVHDSGTSIVGIDVPSQTLGSRCTIKIVCCLAEVTRSSPYWLLKKPT